MTPKEKNIEDDFIRQLQQLKYTYREDIRSQGALEQNFRAHFNALNRVNLTDGEFSRLLSSIVTPNVFQAAKNLRNRHTLEREDGTPLHYTLVNTQDWCKNSFEVINQLRSDTNSSYHRYDVILLMNGLPVVQIELKTLGISPRRAMQQIVDYKRDPGNGYQSTLLCFVQLFIVSNRDDSYYFANNNDKHLSFAVLDFACGSGSLLLNVRQQLGAGSIGMIYGQEKNITTYNLARMNMLLHGLKDTEFKIHHGDSLLNDWDVLSERNPSKKMAFDAVVANPPFSYRWQPTDALAEDFRFKDYGLAPKSAADFAFLLHGFHFLAEDGTMAIILPHGVLFRGGAEQRIRSKLLQDNHIDAVIGLPANLFYSTGIPVCILVLKKCKKFDDVLVINASEHYDKGKRQNALAPEHIDKIVNTYQQRQDEERYAKVVSLAEIADNDFNLNISRYVSTAEPEEEIDLTAVHEELLEVEERIARATKTHNKFLEELGLPLLE